MKYKQTAGALVTPEQKATAQRYAIFSEAAYFNNPTDKRRILDKYGKQAWDIVPLTTIDATTFRNRNTDEVVVGVRGTDVSNISDLLTDIAIVGGVSNFTPRQAVVNNIVQNAINVYGKDKVVLSGHSLGGKLSTNAANKFGLRAYIYNAASSPLDIFSRSNKNIQNFSTNYAGNRDIVSWFGSLFNKYNQAEFNPTQSSVHTLQNFLPQNEAEIALTGTGRRKISVRRGNPFNPNIGKQKGIRIKR